MKTEAKSFLVFLLALGCIWAGCSSPSNGGASALPRGGSVEANITKQIADVLKECQTIKPGMTRAQLLTVFMPEGGLSAPRERTYVYRGCPYIKVDVEFRLSDPNQRAAESPAQQASDERPTDIITGISRPYLAWSVID